MKILLDECVPWPMRRILVHHECRTAQQAGWGGIKNGLLLRHAESEFDLFVTADQNLRYQQNLAAKEMIQQAVAETKPGGFRQLQIH